MSERQETVGCPDGESEDSAKGCSGEISREVISGNQGFRGAQIQRSKRGEGEACGERCAVTSTSSRNLYPSFELEINKEMFTPAREQFSQEKEEGWWDTDMEGRKEKLAVKGAVTSTASGSKNPDRKADNWFPGRATITKEESEGVKLTAAESQEVDEVVPEIQPSSNEAEGDFVMCEVEEQQAVRVKVQTLKRKAVILMENQKKLKTMFLNGGFMGDISQEEVEEIGFVPSALREPRRAVHCATVNAVNTASSSTKSW